MSGLIFNGISKIMPRWPFLSGVTKLRYFPIRSHDFQESFDFIGHCLKVMTPDKKDRIGIILDINQSRLIF